MYIKKIRLKNIRRFGSLTLDFSNGSDLQTGVRMTTLVIGKNATCKTTLLRSIVIGLTDRAEGNALLAEEGVDLIGDKNKTAEIEIHLTSPEEGNQVIKTILECKVDRDEVVEQIPTSFKSPFVCGYGVSRDSKGPIEALYRLANSAYTLFKYDSYLIDPELALRRLRDFRDEAFYHSIMKSLKDSIGMDSKDEFILEKGGGVSVRSRTIGKFPIASWADGYRVPFNLILDVYAWAMHATTVTKDGGVKGLILIDEIGQHLHPFLQVDALNRLQSLFRESQLIATSHSPIVALGTQPFELIALRAKRKYVEEIIDIPDYSCASAEDILVDERLFDGPAYSAEKHKLTKRYDFLRRIPKSKRTAAQIKQLVKLASKLGRNLDAVDKEDTVVAELRKIRESLGR